MKYLYCLLIVLLYSCEPPVKFQEAQPQGSENREAFPESYQGDYLCTEDSTIVKIRNRHIYEEIAYFIIDEVDGSGPDSMISMKEVMTESGWEQLYFLGDETLPLEEVLFTDEMFVARLIHRDTLFTVGAPDQRLRYYRGHLLLNFHRDDLDWDVLLLSQDNTGDVSLSKTKMPEDLEAVSKITPVTETITTHGDDQLILNPTRGEFRKLINRGLLFEKCAHYERLPEYSWADRLFN